MAHVAFDWIDADLLAWRLDARTNILSTLLFRPLHLLLDGGRKLAPDSRRQKTVGDLLHVLSAVRASWARPTAVFLPSPHFVAVAVLVERVVPAIAVVTCLDVCILGKEVIVVAVRLKSLLRGLSGVC